MMYDNVISLNELSVRPILDRSRSYTVKLLIGLFKVYPIILGCIGDIRYMDFYNGFYLKNKTLTKSSFFEMRNKKSYELKSQKLFQDPF